MSKYQTEITREFNDYIENSTKFFEKGNKAASTRARKALLNIAKLCKAGRKEILEAKNLSPEQLKDASKASDIDPWLQTK